MFRKRIRSDKSATVCVRVMHMSAALAPTAIDCVESCCGHIARKSQITRHSQQRTRKNTNTAAVAAMAAAASQQIHTHTHTGELSCCTDSRLTDDFTTR